MVYFVVQGDGGNTPFLRSGSNCLDFFVVMVSFVCDLTLLVNSSAVGPGILFLRAFRALRPLRLLNRRRGMRMVVSALYLASGPILNVVAVAFVVMSMFAIAGVQIYQGKLQFCNDPLFPPDTPLSYCVGTFSLHPGSSLIQRSIVTPRMNFDSFPLAMLTLFIASTAEGWPDVMDKLASITSQGNSPLRGASWWNAYFIVVYVAVARYFLLNLFTAVLWANYSLLVSWARISKQFCVLRVHTCENCCRRALFLAWVFLPIASANGCNLSYSCYTRGHFERHFCSLVTVGAAVPSRWSNLSALDGS